MYDCPFAGWYLGRVVGAVQSMRTRLSVDGILLLIVAGEWRIICELARVEKIASSRLTPGP